MSDPIPLPVDAVDSALKRAEHYRLLNEAAQAESICRDIVAVDPDNENAWVYLLLSLTDQFPEDMTEALAGAQDALSHIKDEYKHVYYEGIVFERWGRANLLHGRGIQAVQGWINRAMQCYCRARDLAPSDDPDPTLRWNTCARMQAKIAKSAPRVSPMAKRDMSSEYDEVPQRRRPSST